MKVFFLLPVLIVFNLSVYASGITNADTTSPKAKPHKPTLVGAPVIAYSPETGFQFGIGSKFIFKIQKDSADVRSSFLAFSARYTMLNQIIFNPNYVIFFNEEKYLLKGELGFTKFPQNYFGIGNNTPEENAENVSMKSIKLDQVLYRKVYKNLFLGLGYRYNYTYDVIMKRFGTLHREKPPGYQGYVTSGLILAATIDNRDNILSPASGELIELSGGYHGQYLGGSVNYDVYELDARKYIKVFNERKDIFAIQFYGIVSTGNTPFAEMAALGGDKIMRGYYRGRYRDNSIAVLQAEYRMPVYKRFGTTFFGGIGDVYHKIKDFDLQELKPSYGMGIRYQVSKKDNLNIRFDYGFGKGVSNFYLNIAEAF